MANPAAPPATEDTTALIDRVSQIFAGLRDPEAALRAAAGCVIPELADLVVLVLGDATVDRIIAAAPHPDRERRASELVTEALPAMGRVAADHLRRGRRFRWVSSVNPISTRFLAQEPELLRLLARLEIGSLMVMPLRSGGKTLGGIGFARTSGRASPHYHASDLATAQVIARHLALGIEHAELRKRSDDEERRRGRLEDALQKWIKVFDVADWGAAIVDADDLRIEAANPAFARMHGYAEPENLIGQGYAVVLPADRAGETASWADQGRHSQGQESLHRRQTGELFPVFSNVTALETAPGVKSYVVTVQEVTELKRAEERLRRAQRMEAVGRLAGGVAHEVNNMMTIILGFSDLLTAATDLPEKRQRDVVEIRKAAIRTARVTQQLLAFSRQQILQPADLQLNEIVADMSSVLQHLLPANVKVETAISPIPAAVHADRAQVDQVLINLAFNARDAMPLGGTIRLATDSRFFEPDEGRHLIGIPIARGQYAVLSVSDTGHGMSRETMSQVFEPFFTTKPVGTGTGLGLATVYGIVKQSGGFIWVESEAGIGTTFTVCLPQVGQRAAEDIEVSPHAREEPRSPGALVLIVEDEDGVRELARRVLEEEGYTVADVRSGAEAMQLLDARAQELDLVLSDVIMPDMAAIELEAGVRARRPEIPFLYMSGYGREEVLSRGLVPSGRRFIQKPFTATELADAVGHALAAAEPRGRTVTA